MSQFAFLQREWSAVFEHRAFHGDRFGDPCNYGVPLHNCTDDPPPAPAAGVERFPLAEGVEALSLIDLCAELSAA